MSDILSRFLNLMKDERETIDSFGVGRIGIFGSCVRGEDNPESDIDVLVVFKIKSFDNYMDLKFFLEDHFKRAVDLVMLESVKPALRDEILSEVKYAA